MTEHIRYLGLDVHKATIAVAVAERGTEPARSRGTINHRPEAVAKLGDLSRFPSARALMGYVGLGPREHSCGGRVRRGGISKRGNSHARRVVVEAAWHYRHAPGVGPALQRRRRNQPAEVVAIADKAHARLHRRYRKLLGRGKLPQLAVVAVARELLGFIWAIARELAASRAAAAPEPGVVAEPAGAREQAAATESGATTEQAA